MDKEAKEGYLSESDLKIMSSATTSKPMILLDKDKYDELIEYEANKHYIELGKALVKSKEQNFGIFQWTEYAGANTNWYPISDYEIERLLEWAEGRK